MEKHCLNCKHVFYHAAFDGEIIQTECANSAPFDGSDCGWEFDPSAEARQRSYIYEYGEWSDAD